MWCVETRWMVSKPLVATRSVVVLMPDTTCIRRVSSSSVERCPGGGDEGYLVGDGVEGGELVGGA
jgi:hypothetical protein